MIKCGLAVCRDHDPAAVAQVVAFADLATLETGHFGKFGIVQDIVEAGLIFGAECHSGGV